MHYFVKLVLTIAFGVVFLLTAGHPTARAENVPVASSTGLTTTDSLASVTPATDWQVSDSEDISEHALPTAINTQTTAAVQGTVYVDTNGNGQHDADEGVEGATVSLSQTPQYVSIATLVLPLSVVTGPDGSYHFDNVPLGNYTLTVTLPGEPQPIHSQIVDVAAEPVTSVDPISLTTGTQAVATVQGVIYLDANSNGRLDADEGVEGATVSLSGSPQYVSVTTLLFPLIAKTGLDGSYHFDNVLPGKYTLTVTLPGESQPVLIQTVDVGAEPVTSVDPIAVTTGTQAGATVQGAIYIDANANSQHDKGEGVEGATVSLSRTAQYVSVTTLLLPLAAVTGPDGSYRFDNVPRGKYTLLVTLPGESQPANSQTVDVEVELVMSVHPIALLRSRDLYLPAITVAPAQATPAAHSQRQFLPSLLSNRCVYQDSSHFGVQMYDDTGSASPYYPALRQSGARWVRVAVPWLSVEPQNTTPDNYRWASADAAVAAATDACLTLIVTHSANPKWAAVDREGRVNRENLGDMQEYIRALVERYDGDGIDDAPNSPVVNYWELYNEPDVTGSYGWGYIGNEYVEMLALMYPTIKNANSNAKVLLGGIASDWFVDDPHNPGTFVRGFLDQVLAHGGGQYFDIMNFHGYPSFSTEWTDNGGPGLYEKTEFMRAKLQEYGLNKPIMITESGWHSGELIDGVAVNNTGTPELQARYVVALFTQSLAQHVQAMIYWMLYDIGQSYPFASGLVTNNSPPSPKPAFAAYQVAVSKLGTAQFQRRLSEAEVRGKTIEAYEFQDPIRNHTIYVAWLNPIDLDIFPAKYPPSESESETLRVRGSHATVSDIFGNTVAEIADEDDGFENRSIRVNVTRDPIYIIVEE